MYYFTIKNVSDSAEFHLFNNREAADLEADQNSSVFPAANMIFPSNGAYTKDLIMAKLYLTGNKTPDDISAALNILADPANGLMNPDEWQETLVESSRYLHMSVNDILGEIYERNLNCWNEEADRLSYSDNGTYDDIPYEEPPYDPCG